MAESDRQLLERLGVSTERQKLAARTPREERIIVGFEEIQRFVAKRGHQPRYGNGHDIFERMCAARLDALRALDEARSLLAAMDHQGLLSDDTTDAVVRDDLSDEELLAKLQIPTAPTEITDLKHVRSSVEKRAAEEIATRTPCQDFSNFKPLFAQVREDLDTGVRETRVFGKDTNVQQGDFFILGGQIAYVAEAGQEFVTEYERKNRRLRVIYHNGTESDLLQRSLTRALYKDDAGRRITRLSAGPLFTSHAEAEDTQSGTIYVLRSKSDHPDIAASRDLIHKIGVTGSVVETRIANAKLDATFLMADVEIVATYELYNINRTKLENLLHRVFKPARLAITIPDRFGNPVTPREWFLVPLDAINEAIEKIKNGTIENHIYDPKQAKLVEAPSLE